MGENPRLRIGVVNYLNAYPLWAAMEPEGLPVAADFHSNKSGAGELPAAVRTFESFSRDAATAGRNTIVPQIGLETSVDLVPGVPSFLAGELHAGRLDAALISSVEYLRHPQGFVYHPSLCIAATRESKSIRLFLPDASQPFAVALKNTKTIYTDIASRSSVAQLVVMLHELEINPRLEEITSAGERIAALRAGQALLSIGDTALAHMQESSYDLQQQYFELFNHGFVYALWVMRAEKRQVLEPLLNAAHEAYKADVSTYIEHAAQRFGFSAEFTQTYLTETIEHVLSPERKADLQFFADNLKGL